MSQTSPAILVLADGTVFRGTAIGASGSSVGEVVFNTSITGYQEILTDPSYSRQIVTLTYPHIGNVGCNPEDVESRQVFASGLIIRDLSMTVSNFRSTQTLPEYLKANNVVAIAGIDTRKLTRILRTKGAQNGCIATGDDAEAALKAARNFAGLAGMDLAQVVTCDKPYEWKQRLWELGVGYRDTGYGIQDSGKSGAAGSAESRILNPASFHVVAYDFGVKRNILRMLAERGCRVTVVPAKTSAAEALALKPDGVFLSNGPGDPEPCDYAIAATKKFIEVGDSVVRHLSGTSDHGAGRGCEDREDEVRPSRRQSSGAGYSDQARHDHQPEPRFCGGCGNAAQECARHAYLAVRRHAARFRTDR